MTSNPKNDARYQRGYVPDSAEADLAAFLSPASDNQPRASADLSEIDSEPALDAAELLDEFEPRNPFLIALWVIGPALLIGGLTMQVRSFLFPFFGMDRNFTSAGLPWEMIETQVFIALAPPMTMTGLATVLGLLFLCAIRWRSRSTRR